MDEYQSLMRETFVVRLWREAPNLAWRGQIVHLPDQASIHFTTLAEAEAFIHRYAPDVQVGQPHGLNNPGASTDSPPHEPSAGASAPFSTPIGAERPA